jgi:L-lactate utilization protein LutB
MSAQTSLNFRANAAKTIKDAPLRAAMRNAADTFGTRRTSAMYAVDFEALREKASGIRMHVLDNLPAYLEKFTAQATKAGATVLKGKRGDDAEVGDGQV